jgi:CHAT domain-containing protein
MKSCAAGEGEIEMQHALRALLVLLCVAWPGWVQTQPAPRAAESALLERYHALRIRGVASAQQGDYKKALEHFEEALSIARQSADPLLEAKATFNVGLAHSNLRESQTALGELQSVLQIIEQHRLQEPELRANALVNIALIYGADTDAAGPGDQTTGQGVFPDKKTAIEYAERALPDLHGVRKAHVLAQMGIWMAPNTAEDLEKALRNSYEAAKLYREAGDWGNFANIQMGIGMLLEAHFRFDKAVSAYQEALGAARQTQESRLSFRALRALARMNTRQSHYEQAITHYLEALEIASHIGLLEQGWILSDLAELYGELGAYPHQIDYLKRAVNLYQELGNAIALAETLRSLGLTYDYAGEYGKAAEAFELALKALTAAGKEEQRREEQYAEILNSYASTLKRRGDSAKALSLYQEAFHLWKKLGQEDKAADTAGRALLTPGAQELPKTEREAWKNALLVPTRPDLTGVLRSRATLVAIAENRLADAAKFIEEAQLAYEQTGNITGQMETRATRGWIRELQGHYRLALMDYEAALNDFESRRESTKVSELQISMAGTSANVYDRAMRMALRLQDIPRAVFLTERSRSRSLLDRLAALSIDLPQEAPPEARRLQQLSEDMRRLTKRIASEKSPDNLARSRQEMDSKEREYYHLINTPVLTAYNRRLLGLPRPVEDIQKLLDEKTTLISYFVTSEDTFAFILTRTSVEQLSLGVRRDELNRVIRESREQSTDPRYAPAWTQLSAWLIGPVRGKVQTPRLGIIPHGELNAVSFAFLPLDGDRRLIDDYIIFYLPNASSLALLPANHLVTKPTFLAVSQPQGEEIAAEERLSDLTIDLISAQFDGTLLKDDIATESMVRQQAPKANILYLSAHALADKKFPALSAIHLKKDVGNDGKLTVEEIYGLTLKGTDLVVLSACETGAGKVQAGDELVSLNRAFHAAGVPTVISTLQRVDSKVSSALMEKFFEYLHEGKSKAEALALAQRSSDRAQPDWAAFILTGRPGDGL